MSYVDHHPYPGPRNPNVVEKSSMWDDWQLARVEHAIALALDEAVAVARSLAPTSANHELLARVAMYCQQLGETLPEDLFP